MRKFILLIILLSLVVRLSAQNVASARLSWTASKMIDADHNVTIDNSSVFRTTSSKVEWDQGKVVDVFSITGSSGSWTNVTENGRIVLSISDGGDSGTITIEKNGAATKLTLDISQGTSPRLIRAFTISSVNQIN